MSKFAALVCAIILFTASSAFADIADCRKEAEARVNGSDLPNVAVAMFYEPGRPPPGKKLELKRPCTGATCRQVYFAMKKDAPVTAPAGFVPETAEFIGAAGAPQWRPLAKKAESKCDSLYILKFRPASAAQPETGTTPAGATDGGKKPVDAKGKEQPPKLEGNLQSDLLMYQDKMTQRTLAVAAPMGVPQGLPDIAAETVQILGQIVVDRASAEAYRLLKERLIRLLQCDADQSAAATNAQTPQAGWKPPRPTFPATCKVLKPLRLQDVATSRDLLLGAVAADAIAYLDNVQSSLPDKAKDAEKIGAAVVVTSAIVPIIVRPRILVDIEPARVVLGAILAQFKSLGGELNPAQTVLAAGVLAYLQCAESTAQPGSQITLADCDVGAYADRYVGNNVEARVASHSLAGSLVSVATLMDHEGKPDVRRRVIHAVDALFASACMLAQADPKPKFACPAVPDKIDLRQLSVVQALSLLQPIVDAALEGDSNALIVAIAQPLELLAACEYRQTHQRAFLLLGSILQYSATYAQDDKSNPQQMHEQRTKILESLTKDMTDRTARDGDNVWSFGGSLRAMGGVRAGAGGAAFFGPLGLPLGIGFDHVADGRAAGIHLEFSPIDIGQYVSYDKAGVVKTPDLADAFSPSFTIAAGWGKSIPLILGATVGYSPTLTTSSTSTTRGTFNAAAILGMYVPLIDMN